MICVDSICLLGNQVTNYIKKSLQFLKILPLLGSVLDVLKKEGYHVFVSFNNTELEMKKLQCKLI